MIYSGIIFPGEEAMGSKLSTKIINIIFVFLQILLVSAFIAKKQYFSVVGTAFIFIIFLFFLFYEHKKGIAITNFIRILVLVSVLSNSFLGEYIGLYNTSVYFDKLLHVFGTFSFSVFIFSIAEKTGSPLRLGRAFIFIYILLLGSFLGTMFEIGEFICDVIFETVNQSDLIDTNLDMICNTLGAAIAGTFIVFKKHLPK